MTPTKEEALQFALMLDSGVPPEDAIRYFAEEGLEAKVMADLCRSWMRSRAVEAAIKQVQGKDWQEMGVEERIKFALNKHYCEMAYYLYSNNYASSVSKIDKNKADTCRQALEAKVAGMAGQMDGLTRFLADVSSGAVRLPSVKAPTTH